LLSPYGAIAIFTVIAILFGGTALVIAQILRPHNPDEVKQATYECGMESTDSAWIQYRPGFYIYALVFVIFDVETVFLYPWAVAYDRLGLFAFVEMMVFIGILLVGLVYAWRKQALRWW
jgi:NADH-quinone oxidoreductase subunit A